MLRDAICMPMSIIHYNSFKPTFRWRKPRRTAVSKQSIYRGIFWHQGRWQVEIQHGRENVVLGRFLDEVEAARQYDRGMRLLFGPDAETNRKLGLL